MDAEVHSDSDVKKRKTIKVKQNLFETEVEETLSLLSDVKGSQNYELLLSYNDCYLTFGFMKTLRSHLLHVQAYQFCFEKELVSLVS